MILFCRDLQFSASLPCNRAPDISRRADLLPHRNHRGLVRALRILTPLGHLRCRGALAQLLAARSRHRDFIAYHIRFCYNNTKLLYRCGLRKNETHFFFCVKNPLKHLLRFYRGQVMTLEDLVTTMRGASCFSAWRNSRVCTRRRARL